MPNWTSNVLDVTFRGVKGKAQLEEFHKRVYSLKKKEDSDELLPFFDFRGTVPMPAELEGTTSPAQGDEEIKLQAEHCKKYGAGNWFDWQCKFWTVKWGACDALEPEVLPKGYRYQFETAWTVPARWIEATAKQFPLLTFKDLARFESGGACVFKVCTRQGLVEFQERDIDGHNFCMGFDESYKKEYYFIVRGDYDRVIKRYSKSDLDHYDLAPFLIRRIRRHDLPLFIEFEWNRNEYKILFTEKLKGVKNVESVSKGASD